MSENKLDAVPPVENPPGENNPIQPGSADSTLVETVSVESTTLDPDQDQIAQWLAEADVAAKAEDWDNAIALYRKAMTQDRIREGTEAKLQWALRMRDIDKLYRDGKAKFDAGDFEGALPLLRKARVMYAGHYKDADELIVQAQTHVQQDQWDARTDQTQAPARGRSPIFIIGAIGVIVIGILMFAVLYMQGNPPPDPLPVLGPGIPPVTGTVRQTPSGLQMVMVQPGTGAEALPGKIVSVHYTGYLTDGTKFDSSIGNEPYTFPLGTGSVIPGWDEGLEGMKVGEKRRLFIPPELAYGPEGAGGVIPPNATLVFDVELTEVQ